MSGQPADRFTPVLAALLKAAKDASPYSVRSLAAESGLAVSTVQRYLDGTRDIPVPALYAMCRVLGVSARDMLDRAEAQV